MHLYIIKKSKIEKRIIISPFPPWSCKCQLRIKIFINLVFNDNCIKFLSEKNQWIPRMSIICLNINDFIQVYKVLRYSNTIDLYKTQKEEKKLFKRIKD